MTECTQTRETAALVAAGGGSRHAPPSSSASRRAPLRTLGAAATCSQSSLATPALAAGALAGSRHARRRADALRSIWSSTDSEPSGAGGAAARRRSARRRRAVAGERYLDHQRPALDEPDAQLSGARRAHGHAARARLRRRDQRRRAARRRARRSRSAARRCATRSGARARRRGRGAGAPDAVQHDAVRGRGRRPRPAHHPQRQPAAARWSARRAGSPARSPPSPGATGRRCAPAAATPCASTPAPSAPQAGRLEVAPAEQEVQLETGRGRDPFAGFDPFGAMRRIGGSRLFDSFFGAAR